MRRRCRSVRAVGDRAGEATTLNNMAGVYDAIGQPQRALALYEEALPIRRAVGHRAGEAITLNNMAILLYQQLDRTADGIRRMVEAITVLERTGLSRDASGATVEQFQAALATMRAGKPLW
ncbi:MAG: tetratricopeptide repeat protein [Anaerolineae bacterium]|nr:tetratricopeptide repeat protein [Anaerolineae bacterium]